MWWVTRSRLQGISSRSHREGDTRFALDSAERKQSYTDAMNILRDRFPILNDRAYLVNHSLGAMPEAASEELALYATEWATRGVEAWSEGWWETSVTIGDETSTLVAGDVAVINRGVPHSLTSPGGCSFIEALSPLPRDHVPDFERDLVLGSQGNTLHVER